MEQRRKIYATLIVLIAALLFLSSAAIATDPLPCNNYICKGQYYLDGVKDGTGGPSPVAIVNDTAYSIIMYANTTCSNLAGTTDIVHLMTAPHAIWPTPPPYVGYDGISTLVSIVYIGPTNKTFDLEAAGIYNTPEWGEGASFSCVITSPTL